MTNLWRGIFLFLLTALLIGCSEQDAAVDSQTTIESVGSVNVANSTGSHDHATPEFIPDYISAADLNARFEQRSEPFIFDVRSKASYEKSHIQSALWVPYGNTEESDLLKIANLQSDSEIVTYCGCPRHLSSLQAKFLQDLGYSNVKVLYDGLWVWQDNGFPTFYAHSTQTTLLKFNGKLIGQDKNISQTDVFLRHVKTGQLEAARSSFDGEFNFDFHLYEYRPGDEFELTISKLNSPVVKTLVLNKSDVGAEIQIEVLL